MDDLKLDTNTDFNYPLVGGETLYALIDELNKTFNLNLSKDEYHDATTERNEEDKIILRATSKYGFNDFTFISQAETLKIEKLALSPETHHVKKTIILNFKEEIGFFSTVIINKPIYFNITNKNIILPLHELLTFYRDEEWNVTGTETSVDQCILRYYGSGDNVPVMYGHYDSDLTVAIVDLKRHGSYQTYCLRNKIYHVYSNGYRSWN